MKILIPTCMNRLAQQIDFIVEIDKLKQILRRTLITDAFRHENTAEHSWHIAVMAIVLAEYAPPDVDLWRTVKMLLIHDIVEIDAGDTFCYDLEAARSKAQRETAAAQRLFSILPSDQAAELRHIWEEFEAQQTVTAKFAAALDRIQPLLNNYHTQGKSWQHHGINSTQVRQRMHPVKDGAPELWQLVEQTIEKSVVEGYLKA